MTAQPVDTTPPTGPTQNAPQEGKGNCAWHVLDEPAAVRFLPSGTPLALRWRGSIWQVIGEPLAWSSTDRRQLPDTTSPGEDSRRSSLGSVVTTRFWRFRAQTGPASPVLEFDMNADARWDDWRLRRVTTVDGY
ncbi:hypothetical protein [Arthrobacter sp. MDT1-65]